jgi:hypothetical protein
MKTFVLLLCITLSGGLIAGDKEREPHLPKNDQDAVNAAERERLIQYYRKLPIEQQPVVYVQVGKGEFAPAQIDPVHNIEYRWKGVLLKPHEIPTPAAGGSFSILPIPPTGLPVKNIDPPIRYYKIGSSITYGVGYYDVTHNIIFRWKDIEYTKAQLLQDAIKLGLLLSDDLVGEISTIEAPTSAQNREVPAAENGAVPKPRNHTSPKQEGGSGSKPNAFAAVDKLGERAPLFDGWVLWASIAGVLAAAAGWLLLRGRGSRRGP